MLIGLKGYKGVGKDTVADYLVAQHGFTKIAFADKLKEAVAALFDISREQVDLFKENNGNTIDLVEIRLNIAKADPAKSPVEYVYTWRELLQRFGTEMGRGVFGQSFWITQVHDQLPIKQEWKTALSYDWVVDGDFVIPDTRFENEARFVRSLSGKVVEITRLGYEPDGHSSEEPLPDSLIDYRMTNDHFFATLYDDVDRMLNELR